MLSRALYAKPRRSFKSTYYGWSKSASLDEYNDSCSTVGFMEDLPLILCDRLHNNNNNKARPSRLPHSRDDDDDDHDNDDESRDQLQLRVGLSLKDVLRASVGVLGEGRVGLTEKVVLFGGRVLVLKRFRKPCVGKSEFGKRIERFSQVKSKNLVPFRAYIYAKRIKFVLCDYYPMGSLNDLLFGNRQHGHTPLDWDQRLKIIVNISQAIDFIHSITPAQELKNVQMNVHGNVKTSNVMINTDFSACLSDYGVSQLAERVEAWNYSQPSHFINYYSDKICQKCDVYNFGVVILDILGGPTGINLFMTCPVSETKESVKRGDIEFFEFDLKGRCYKKRKQALLVLDIALACLNKQPEARPSIEQILLYLGDVRSISIA